MTDQEILTKVIEKAVKNEFDVLDFLKRTWGITAHQAAMTKDELKNYLLQFLTNTFAYTTHPKVHKEILREHKLLLTDHTFCKAFWGNGKKERYTYDGRKYIFVYDNMRNFTPRWKYYLPLMVITNNWLQYIKQFLEGKCNH